MDKAKTISVVVPTYNETGNLKELTRRLFAATRGANIETELIIADDESSGTKESEEIVAELAKQYETVRMHIRRRGEGRGLSSAVLLGFGLASHDILVCMDADLQHEPEAVPAMVEPILTEEADFAIGSRHVDQGGVGFEWSLVRRLISCGATLLARPLTSSTDPMSGFFCLHKKTLQKGIHQCNPRGFKIALELMVRCHCTNVRDVPIVFRERVTGESKLSMRQNIEYLKQLIALYFFLYARLILTIAFVLFAILLALAYRILLLS